MTPTEITDARRVIGLAWGLKRPLLKAELADLLGYINRDIGAPIAEWELGRAKVPGPAVVAIQALLDGWRPPHWRRVIRTRGNKADPTGGGENTPPQP